MTASADLLVVEDDEQMLRVFVKMLEREGYTCRGTQTAGGARDALAERTPDLIVLDLVLPDEDGLDLLAWIRDQDGPPVIVVSGRTSVGDRVLGLDAGADDYVTKPVASHELIARVRAVLRRFDEPERRLAYGPLEIDRESRQVRLSGELVELTRKEFDLLVVLASNPGRAFSRRDLLAEVWGSAPEYQGADTVTEHVRRLRQKLGDDPEVPRWIVTMRGVGYRFDPEVPGGAADADD